MWIVVASFHLMQVHALFAGTAAEPRAQYVEVRMTAAGQTLVANRRIRQQHGDGAQAPDFAVFVQVTARGEPGASLLACTREAEALFAIACDQVTTGALVQPDGRVCWEDPAFDCVAFGDFGGDNAGYGDPAPALVSGRALVRIGTSGDNATDFALAEPAPRNNAGDVGGLPEAPDGGVDGGADAAADAPSAVSASSPALAASPDATWGPGFVDAPPERGCGGAGAVAAGLALLAPLAAARRRRGRPDRRALAIPGVEGGRR
jgi:hypothetical protein